MYKAHATASNAITAVSRAEAEFLKLSLYTGVKNLNGELTEFRARIIMEDMNIDLGILVLRVCIGLMMLVGHGWQKLMHFSEIAMTFPNPIGLGSKFSLALVIFAEVFCSIFVIIGFRTRYVVIPLIINMLVAILLIHGHDPWAKKEFALLYLVPLCFALLRGFWPLFGRTVEHVDVYSDSQKPSSCCRL